MTQNADDFVTTGLSLPRSIMDRVQAEAERQKRSRSSQIALILQEYFERIDGARALLAGLEAKGN
jgi:metal-responsive CopG/Arc/MetJ family transcriptional regulator